MKRFPKKFLAPARFLTVTNIVAEIVLCYENLPKEYYGKKAKTLTTKNIVNKLTVGLCNKLTKQYFAYQELDVDVDDITLENTIVKFLLKNDFIYIKQ